ncbi:MAG: kelch repeat-containing protein [Deltaproteobacteria bacterium]|nr:kelch repeat-containing protein [Deltaproteobacteria bacterium]
MKRVAAALVLIVVNGCECDVEPVDQILCDFTVQALGGTTVDFGTVAVNGGERSASFVIENIGNRPLNAFTIGFTGNESQYDVDVPDDFQVTPGDDEALVVSFAPTQETTLNAEMRVSHVDLGSNGCPVRSITLLGEGVAQPPVDAGFPDAGFPDGGFFVDGGVVDAGFVGDPDGGVILPPNAAWRAYGGLEEARGGAATVELLDGSLLLIGGYGENGAVLDSIERFDPVLGRSRVAARMAQGRAEPGAVMLGNGQIAIAGGRTQRVGGVVVTSVEIFNPDDDTILCPGSQATLNLCSDNGLGFLQNARIDPIVTSLGGNLIAVAAGKELNGTGAEVASPGGDVVDVISGTVTAIDGLPARFDEARVSGPGGDFLLVGGRNINGVPQLDVVRFVGSTRIAGTLIDLPGVRAAAGTAVLEDGSVLVTGGTGGTGAVLTDALLLRDAFGTASVQPLTLTLDPRVEPTVTALPGDIILIAGGLPSEVVDVDDDDSVVPLTSAEILVPFGAAGFARFATDNDLAQGRIGGAAVVSDDDDDVVTFVGGFAVQPRKAAHPHAEQYRLVDNVFSSFGLMGAGTALAAAAIFEVSDAALVSLGGVDPHTGATSARSRAFDAIGGGFVDVTSLRAPRRDHSATSIAADLIVVIGGRDANGNVIGSASILDVDGQDLPLPVSLRRARAGHTANLLPLAAGLGENVILLCGGSGTGGEPLDTCELFKAPSDPRDVATFNTASFTLVGDRLSTGRVGHSATQLALGEVLLIGGGDIENDQVAADIFIPDASQGSRLVATGVPSRARRDHASIALGGGRVLVAGGDIFAGGIAPTRTAEVYSRSSETFTPVEDMEEPRSKPALFLLADGQVLVSGGTKSLGESGFPFIAVIESELFNPGPTGIGTFEAIEIPLSYGRADLIQADLLGRAVVVGGSHRDGITSTGDERRTPQHFVDMLEEGLEP